MTRTVEQDLPVVQQEKPPRDLTGGWECFRSGCHKGQLPPGGQYSVPAGLSRSHGCWAASILSSWSSRGHLVGWALALGFFMKKDGSAWAQFCLLGLRSIFGIFVCGTRGEIQRDQRNPEPNVVGGEGARQEDATLRSSHRQMRVAWAGTERG